MTISSWQKNDRQFATLFIRLSNFTTQNDYFIDNFVTNLCGSQKKQGIMNCDRHLLDIIF